MAKKLGKVKKPSAKKFAKGRKLFFLPFVLAPEKADPEFKEILERYWRQSSEQIKNLEEKLTRVKRVYHELVADSGEEAVKVVKGLAAGSRDIVKECLEQEAELQPIEDKDLLNEYLDCTRCLSMGLTSKKVFTQIYQSYNEAQKKRQEKIAGIINETLKVDEVGLLVMREGHQVQFPPDIQVFYIAPPALDEIRRYQREHGYRSKESKNKE